MAQSRPSPFARLLIALDLFRRILFDPRFAAAASELRAAWSTVPPEASGPERASLREAEPNAALQLLGLLQRDGRLIDFLEEDVTAYSDSEVGTAARVVHEGCRTALRQHFTIESVRPEAEGTPVTLAQGFDASAVRPTGKVVGEPPFNGRLTHKGWRVTSVRLPKVAAGHDLSILAPAEVEL
jgi:Domain of unknown function (DUF2760)